MKMKTTLPILSFLLMALVGCGKNGEDFIELAKRRDLTVANPYVIRLAALYPLSADPVVEYTVTKNADGVNEYRLFVLKKAASETPKIGRHPAKVSRFDEHNFTVTIPVEKPHENSAHFYFNSEETPSTGYGIAPCKPVKEKLVHEEESESSTAI